VKIDALNHPKTIELAVQLGVCIPQAIGHLELLWAFVAQKTPRGNIGRWSDAVIAHAAQWSEEPEAFAKALIVSGFCDEHDEHRIVIHDWSEHCPNWVRAKLKKERKEFISTDLSKDLSKDITSHYKPSQAKGSKNMSDSGEPDAEYQKARKAYKPRNPNDNNKRAVKAWNARIRAKIPPADLQAGIDRYMAQCVANQTPPNKIMHMSTFLNGDEHWKQPWTVLGKVPDTPADIQRLVDRLGLTLPPNCKAFDARKIISQQTGMSL